VPQAASWRTRSDRLNVHLTVRPNAQYLHSLARGCGGIGVGSDQQPLMSRPCLSLKWRAKCKCKRGIPPFLCRSDWTVDRTDQVNLEWADRQWQRSLIVGLATCSAHHRSHNGDPGYSARQQDEWTMSWWLTRATIATPAEVAALRAEWDRRSSSPRSFRRGRGVLGQRPAPAPEELRPTT
jgi:hypothetical protein